MSREQIEERNELLNIFAPSSLSVEEACILTDKIINAGYRKQSEGEWIRHGYKWQCSNCGVLMDIDGTPTENLLHFCPNCGAKMKGGAE